MSGYTPSLVYETQFDGDHVVFRVKRVRRDLFRKIMPFLPTNEEGEFVENVRMSHAQGMEMLDVVIDDLPQYVESMEGLRDSAGNQLKFEDIVNETYFQVLLMQLVGFMLSNSRPSEEEVGNSDAPHDTTSRGSLPEVQNG